MFSMTIFQTLQVIDEAIRNYMTHSSIQTIKASETFIFKTVTPDLVPLESVWVRRYIGEITQHRFNCSKRFAYAYDQREYYLTYVSE